MEHVADPGGAAENEDPGHQRDAEPGDRAERSRQRPSACTSQPDWQQGERGELDPRAGRESEGRAAAARCGGQRQCHRGGEQEVVGAAGHGHRERWEAEPGEHGSRPASTQRYCNHQRRGERHEHRARGVVERVAYRRDHGGGEIDHVVQQRVGVPVDHVGRHVAVGQRAVKKERGAGRGGKPHVDRARRADGHDGEQRSRRGDTDAEQPRHARRQELVQRPWLGRRPARAGAGRPPHEPPAQVGQWDIARQNAQLEQLMVAREDRDGEAEQRQHVQVAQAEQRQAAGRKHEPERQQREQPRRVAQARSVERRARRVDLRVLNPAAGIHGGHRADSWAVEEGDPGQPRVEHGHAHAVPAMSAQLLVNRRIGERRPHRLLTRQRRLGFTASPQEQRYKSDREDRDGNGEEGSPAHPHCYRRAPPVC